MWKNPNETKRYSQKFEKMQYALNEFEMIITYDDSCDVSACPSTSTSFQLDQSVDVEHHVPPCTYAHSDMFLHYGLPDDDDRLPPSDLTVVDVVGNTTVDRF